MMGKRAWFVLFLASTLALGCDKPPEPGSAASASASATAAPKPAPKPTASVPKGPPLLNPKAATEKAPDSYQVELDTTKGKAVIKVTREWAPRGADRFFNLVKIGYYDDVPFYRVTLEVAQFGINGDPKVTQAWKEAYILDEMVKQPNEKGRVTFARSKSDTRTTQIFINLTDNSGDFHEQGFAPFGEIVDGMDVIAKLSHEHGERPQQGDGPKRMVAEGAEFIKKTFPKLDWIKKATIK
jgi:peptidyl-prolyl cis-trans isomerase A (cyclophilin A)